ncbi:hypothetical protein B0H14DRAFT_3492492 [Mycena olivaceomarginata]|nr:hypothetical protein B0H14DRAFT_3492492 [Mycena olivaceomarginata]
MRDLELDLDPKRLTELETQPLDFEKPGLAQHYCVHKRRCKQLKDPAYTIEESERAAGLGPAERKPPTVAAGMDDVVLAT